MQNFKIFNHLDIYPGYPMEGRAKVNLKVEGEVIAKMEWTFLGIMETKPLKIFNH